MVADGVVGQLIYGTLASQTSADGRSYFANLEARNYERWIKMRPEFLRFLQNRYEILLYLHVLTVAV